MVSVKRLNEKQKSRIGQLKMTLKDLKRNMSKVRTRASVKHIEKQAMRTTSSGKLFQVCKCRKRPRSKVRSRSRAMQSTRNPPSKTLRQALYKSFTN